MFGTRIKIMWKEQRVDPPIDYIMKLIAIKTKVIQNFPLFFVGKDW